MAKLTDPEIERCYHNALRNWNYDGFIVYEKDGAEGLLLHVGMAPKDFSKLLHDFVLVQGGEIDQVVEQRPNWIGQWSHHYDLRPVVNGVPIYVETRLRYRDARDPDDPVIHVVHIKPA